MCKNTTSYPPILKPAIQQIEELKAEVALLRAQMNEVRTLLFTTDAADNTMSAIAVEPEISRTESPISESEPVSQINQNVMSPVSKMLYCTSLTFVDDDMVFPDAHISEDSFEAVYSLVVNGDSACFSLLSDEYAFEFLSGDISKYIEAVAESDSEYDFDVVGLKTVQPGKAVKTAKGWKISQKAKISYLKDE